MNDRDAQRLGWRPIHLREKCLQVACLGVSELDQRLCDISSCNDNDWVSVLFDLSVGLLADVGRGDDDPELAVSNPRQQSGNLLHPETAARALRLKGEFGANRIGPESDSIEAKGVSASIASWGRHHDVSNAVGLHPHYQGSREVLEAVGVPL